MEIKGVNALVIFVVGALFKPNRKRPGHESVNGRAMEFRSVTREPTLRNHGLHSPGLKPWD